MATNLKPGEAVIVGKRFVMGDRVGQGRMVPDQWTGRTGTVLKIESPKFVLVALDGPVAGESDGEVSFHPRRLRRMADAEAIKAADKRIADHIDGYDRDDLGESPDY